MKRLRPLPPALLPALLIAAHPAAAQIHGRIYQPPRTALTLAGLPAGAAFLAVKTADGLTIRGIAVPPRDGRPVLLILHGNGSDASATAAWFAPLAAAGYGIVAAEYREYGGNPGRADEAGLAADADAFYAAARAIAGNARVIVVGHSLGAGVAFGLARRARLDALVTIGAFTRLRAMAPTLVRALIKDRYDNLAAVPSLDEPWFLVHGLADDVVPSAFGNQLHNAAVAAQRTGASFVLTQAGHRPDGATLALVIDTVSAGLDGRPPPTLPDTIRRVPF